MAMPGGEPTYTRPLVEHREPAELLEPTRGGEGGEGGERERERGREGKKEGEIGSVNNKMVDIDIQISLVLISFLKVVVRLLLMINIKRKKYDVLKICS